MIDSRHLHPTHIRDLLLLAAASTAGTPSRTTSTILDEVDIVDVLAVAAELVQGHLHALAAATRSPRARENSVAHVLASASAIVIDHRAVNAVATVVGAAGQGELAVGASIARCLGAFDHRELRQAAIALLTATIAEIATTHGVDVTDVVGWSAGDEVRSARKARPAFCSRDEAVASADAFAGGAVRGSARPR